MCKIKDAMPAIIAGTIFLICSGCFAHTVEQHNVLRQEKEFLFREQQRLLQEKIDKILTEKLTVEKVFRGNVCTLVFSDGSTLTFSSVSNHSAGSHLSIK